MGSDEKAELTITVNMQGIPAVPVVNVYLDRNLLPMTVDDEVQLIATVLPDTATNKNVRWFSSDENVATVDENGLVTAVAKGESTITVETVDGSYKAYCLVSVGLVPEVIYIYPSLENDVFGEHFESLEEIYINVANLVAHLNDLYGEAFPEAGITYYVKVDDKGDTEPLGSGQVTIYQDGTVSYSSGEDTNEFNLYAVTEFEATENFSSRYYVYMSQDSSYPKDDEQTLKTNFMGGTSTPTIPTDNVKVSLQIIGGTQEGNLAGIYFLLCRELDELPEFTTWQDYYEGGAPDDPYPLQGNGGVDLEKFVDEVKMTGVTNNEGIVQWEKPRETLKLGGYYLLQVTPKGYIDNLNLVNPESDDGELLKEVRLARDGSVEREVRNIFVGPGNGDSQVDPPDPGTEDPNDPPGTVPDPPVVSPDPEKEESDDDKADNPSQGGHDGGSGNIKDDNRQNPPIVPKLVGSAPNPEYASSIKGHWAAESVTDLIQRGILSQDNTDNLDGEISLAEVGEILSTIVGEKMPLSIPERETSITRQDLIQIYMVAFGLGQSDSPLLFADKMDINLGARGYIAKATELGFVVGYEDNTFRPNNKITRAEAYTILLRIRANASISI